MSADQHGTGAPVEEAVAAILGFKRVSRLRRHYPDLPLVKALCAAVDVDLVRQVALAPLTVKREQVEARRATRRRELRLDLLDRLGAVVPVGPGRPSDRRRQVTQALIRRAVLGRAKTLEAGVLDESVNALGILALLAVDEELSGEHRRALAHRRDWLARSSLKNAQASRLRQAQAELRLAFELAFPALPAVDTVQEVTQRLLPSVEAQRVTPEVWRDQVAPAFGGRKSIQRFASRGALLTLMVATGLEARALRKRLERAR